MENYFETQPIHWNQFSPKDIMFKSNSITKKLLPEENVLSWTTKESRHNAMAEKTGATGQSHTNWAGKAYSYYPRDSYKGVFVQLIDIKKEFVCANLDFINYLPKVDSQGKPLGGLDALVYIRSWDYRHEWRKDAHGNWVQSPVNKTPLQDGEGYRIAYGGQGGAHYLTHREFLELIDISEAVRNFLIDEVLPIKRGVAKKKALTLVA